MDVNEFPVSSSGEASKRECHRHKNHLNHTSGGKKQLFPSKNSNFFYTAKKKVPQKEPLNKGCVQAWGLGVQKESQRTGSCHGFIFSKGFIFRAEEAEKLPCSS